MKGKEQKERYVHLNAEFQRILRRDKKAFLSDQCKEIEENNRMGKTSKIWKPCSKYNHLKKREKRPAKNIRNEKLGYN